MKFTIAAAVALFGAVSLADNENVEVANFSARKTGDGSIESAKFQITGQDVVGQDCNLETITQVPTDVITCGDSKYRFALEQGDQTEFALHIYHELGTGVGRSGKGDITTHCRTGGGEISICEQQGMPVPIVIGNDPVA